VVAWSKECTGHQRYGWLGLTSDPLVEGKPAGLGSIHQHHVRLTTLPLRYPALRWLFPFHCIQLFQEQQKCVLPNFRNPRTDEISQILGKEASHLISENPQKT